MLTPLGRRILANLPVWTADEDALLAEEGEGAIRSYTLAKFTTDRIGEDPAAPNMTEAQVEASLVDLQGAGLCQEDEEGGWRMTEAGFEALHEQLPQPTDVEPGAVLMELHPAQADANSIGG